MAFPEPLNAKPLFDIKLVVNLPTVEDKIYSLIISQTDNIAIIVRFLPKILSLPDFPDTVRLLATYRTEASEV